jgi:CBS domain containing-hemolysin-like protein
LPIPIKRGPGLHNRHRAAAHAARLWNRQQHFGSGATAIPRKPANVITRTRQRRQSRIADEARSMMLNIIEFADMRVEDVMVPRADIVALGHGEYPSCSRPSSANHRVPIFTRR